MNTRLKCHELRYTNKSVMFLCLHSLVVSYLMHKTVFAPSIIRITQSISNPNTKANGFFFWLCGSLFAWGLQVWQIGPPGINTPREWQIRQPTTKQWDGLMIILFYKQLIRVLVCTHQPQTDVLCLCVSQQIVQIVNTYSGPQTLGKHTVIWNELHSTVYERLAKSNTEED